MKVCSYCFVVYEGTRDRCELDRRQLRTAKTSTVEWWPTIAVCDQCSVVYQKTRETCDRHSEELRAVKDDLSGFPKFAIKICPECSLIYEAEGVRCNRHKVSVPLEEPTPPGPTCSQCGKNIDKGQSRCPECDSPESRIEIARRYLAQADYQAALTALEPVDKNFQESLEAQILYLLASVKLSGTDRYQKQIDQLREVKSFTEPQIKWCAEIFSMRAETAVKVGKGEEAQFHEQLANRVLTGKPLKWSVCSECNKEIEHGQSTCPECDTPNSRVEAAMRYLAQDAYKAAVNALEPVDRNLKEGLEAQILYLLASVKLAGTDRYENQVEELIEVESFNEQLRELVNEIFRMRSAAASKQGKDEEAQRYEQLASRVLEGKPLKWSVCLKCGKEIEHGRSICRECDTPESPIEAAKRYLEQDNYKDALTILAPVTKNLQEGLDAQILYLLASVKLYGLSGYETEVQKLRSGSFFAKNQRELVRELFLVCSEEAAQGKQNEAADEYKKLATRVIRGEPLIWSNCAECGKEIEHGESICPECNSLESPIKAAKRYLGQRDYLKALAVLEPVPRDLTENLEAQLLYLLASVKVHGTAGYEKQLEELTRVEFFSDQQREWVEEIFLMRSAAALKQRKNEEAGRYERLASRVIRPSRDTVADWEIGPPIGSRCSKCGNEIEEGQTICPDCKGSRGGSWPFSIKGPWMFVALGVLAVLMTAIYLISSQRVPPLTVEEADSLQKLVKSGARRVGPGSSVAPGSDDPGVSQTTKKSGETYVDEKLRENRKSRDESSSSEPGKGKFGPDQTASRGNLPGDMFKPTPQGPLSESKTGKSAPDDAVSVMPEPPVPKPEPTKPGADKAAPSPKPEPPAAQPGTYETLRSTGARRYPEDHAEMIDRLRPGTHLNVIGSQGEWLTVFSKSRQMTVYVKRDDARFIALRGRSANSYQDTEILRKKIESEITENLAKWGIPRGEVVVSFRDGTAYLEGQVQNEDARRHAGLAARSIPDVQEIINRIRVKR